MRGYKNFESNPHPGSLRHLVEIGYTENTINENGYPEPTDVVVCTVWSAVTDAGNQHYTLRTFRHKQDSVLVTEIAIIYCIYKSDYPSPDHNI